MIAYCIDPQMVGRIWFRAEDFIRAAVEKCGDWTLREITDALAEGRMLLWLIVEGADIRAAFVTHVTINSKNEKVCDLIAYGGTRADHLIETVEAYASAEGCERVRISGRKGWRRAMEKFGYREPFIVLEKKIKCPV